MTTSKHVGRGIHNGDISGLQEGRVTLALCNRLPKRDPKLHAVVTLGVRGRNNNEETVSRKGGFIAQTGLSDANQAVPLGAELLAEDGRPATEPSRSNAITCG